MRSKKAVLFSSILIFLILIASFAFHSATKNKISSVVYRYYDEISSGHYKEAFDLLYRKDNTMFTDDFLVSGFQNTTLLDYEVCNIKRLADNVYNVSVQIETEQEGKFDCSNYVIFYNSQYYFVLHRTDVPTDLYDFGDAGILPLS